MIDRSRPLKGWIHDSFDPETSACKYCAVRVTSSNTTRKKKVKDSPDTRQHNGRLTKWSLHVVHAIMGSTS